MILDMSALLIDCWVMSTSLSQVWREVTIRLEQRRHICSRRSTVLIFVGYAGSAVFQQLERRTYRKGGTGNSEQTRKLRHVCYLMSLGLLIEVV